MAEKMCWRDSPAGELQQDFHYRSDKDPRNACVAEASLALKATGEGMKDRHEQ